MTMLEAIMLVENLLPGGRISKVIEWQRLFIFQVFFDDDPNEGSYDPFYSVDQDTGGFSDYTIIDENFSEVMSKFSEAN